MELSKPLKRIHLFIPVFFCSLGIYLSFRWFWNGFDQITGDLNDSRFNLIILEHTWLWLKGLHASLFDVPMFHPYPNTYAYSDYLMGYAPIYWIFRSYLDDPYYSFQVWLIICGILNFFSYHFLSRRFFSLSQFWASFAAFLFSFGIPRTMHLYHVQTYPQFFIVLSAIGLLYWKEKPDSKNAPWLFLLGGTLQLISAFYFLWFWILILFFLLAWGISKSERRTLITDSIKQANKKHWGLAFSACLLLAYPFLYHYVLNSKEMGRHGWPSISETIPRLYSWFYISKDHWQGSLNPFMSWIQQLGMPHEQNISLGWITWIGSIWAMFWAWKKKKDYRFLLIPIVAVFVFTLTSGRFSTWILISYLFPGGGVIRAVGRIQIFMLIFWAILLTLYLSSLWKSGEKLKKVGAIILLLGALSETLYTNSRTYSRSHSIQLVKSISDQIPDSCTLVIDTAALGPNRETANINVTLAAFEKRITTMNGYSGHDPKDFSKTIGNLPQLVHGKNICFVR